MVGPHRRRPSRQQPLGELREPVHEIKRLISCYNAYCRAHGLYGAKATPKNLRFFERALTQCHRHGETLEEFTANQIEYVLKLGWQVFPQTFASDRLVAERQEHEHPNVVLLRNYDAQLALFKTRLYDCPPRQLLRDPVSAFHPLFRFCLAVRYELEDVAQEYRDDAAAELIRYPILSELFPNEVRRL